MSNAFQPAGQGGMESAEQNSFDLSETGFAPTNAGAWLADDTRTRGDDTEALSKTSAISAADWGVDASFFSQAERGPISREQSATSTGTAPQRRVGNPLRRASQAADGAGRRGAELRGSSGSGSDGNSERRGGGSSTTDASFVVGTSARSSPASHPSKSPHSGGHEPPASAALSGAARDGEVQVYAPGFRKVLNLPRSAVCHLPPASLNVTRLVLCANYDPRAREPASTCPMGDRCKFVHAETTSAREHAIHVNYAWRSLDEVSYERFAPGEQLQVAAPNSKAATATIDSGLVLKTQALSSSRRPLTHCAHYYFNRTCNLGSECRFVHAVFIDPSAKEHQRAPVPSQRANGPTSHAVSSHHEHESKATKPCQPSRSGREGVPPPPQPSNNAGVPTPSLAEVERLASDLHQRQMQLQAEQSQLYAHMLALQQHHQNQQHYAAAQQQYLAALAAYGYPSHPHYGGFPVAPPAAAPPTGAAPVRQTPSSS